MSDFVELARHIRYRYAIYGISFENLQNDRATLIKQVDEIVEVCLNVISEKSVGFLALIDSYPVPNIGDFDADLYVTATFEISCPSFDEFADARSSGTFGVSLARICGSLSTSTPAKFESGKFTRSARRWRKGEP